jgi:hypothetical protein
MNYDCLVTIGDSWTYGAELQPTIRKAKTFSQIIGETLGIGKVFNIGVESATNFCYKWHWMQWKNTHPEFSNSLVIIGLTDFARVLLTDNMLNRVQEFDYMLYRENHYPYITNEGGLFRLTPMASANRSQKAYDCLDSVDVLGNKKHIATQYYKYQYSDDMGVINTLMELKLLQSLLQSQNGGNIPFVWSNFVDLHVSKHPIFGQEFDHKYFYNDLNKIMDINCNKYVHPNYAHPNTRGHKYIADELIKMVSNVSI